MRKRLWKVQFSFVESSTAFHLDPKEAAKIACLRKGDGVYSVIVKHRDFYPSSYKIEVKDGYAVLVLEEG